MELEQLTQLFEQFMMQVENTEEILLAAQRKRCSKKILLVEFACQDDSEMSKVAEEWGWEILRLTRSMYDLRTKRAKEEVLQIMQQKRKEGYHIVLWGSIPCTPWTRWQDVNIHLWVGI